MSDARRQIGWLTRMIGALDPAAGSMRLARRLQFEQASRAYAAARPGRRDSATKSSSSAVVETTMGLTRLRDLARDMVRNTPEAAAAVTKTAAHIVGDGIYPRAAIQTGDATTDARLNALAQSAFDRWAEQCDPFTGGDFYGLQHLAVTSWRESGEALAMWRPANDRPFQHLQILEGDLLDETVSTRAGRTPSSVPDGHTCVQGVEFDAAGRRVAFHVLPTHPGDGWRFSMDTARVPLAEMDHLFQPMRPGQTRGISPFAPVALRLSDLSGLSDAGIVAARIQSMVGLIVESDAADNLMGPAATGADGNAEVELSPGFIFRSRPGEKISGFAPGGQGANIVAQITREHMIVASALGIPYHILTGDLSRANYISLRGSFLDFYAILDIWQRLVVVPRLIAPAWRRKMQVAALEIPGLNTRQRAAIAAAPAVFTVPRRQHIDPLKDAYAEQLEIRSGVTSMPDALAKRGKTTVEHYAEIAAANAQADALGLVFDTDPRRTAASGSTQARPQDFDLPDAEPPVEA